MVRRLLSFALAVLLSSALFPTTTFAQPPAPVIFIHGLVGDTMTWANLLTFLVERAGWTFGGFPTTAGTFGSPQPGDFYILQFSDSQNLTFAQQGQELAQIVDTVLDVNPESTQVILVGHSMGGLAARSYLQFFGGGGKVARLITVGTPHQGAEIAAFCQLFAFPLNVCQWIGINPFSEAVTELKPDSLALQTLNDVQNHPLPEDVVYTSIIGAGRPTVIDLGPPPKFQGGDGIVARQSQDLKSVLKDHHPDVEKHAKTVTIQSCGPFSWPETHLCETSDIGVWKQIFDSLETPISTGTPFRFPNRVRAIGSTWTDMGNIFEYDGKVAQSCPPGTVSQVGNFNFSGIRGTINGIEVRCNAWKAPVNVCSGGQVGNGNLEIGLSWDRGINVVGKDLPASNLLTTTPTIYTVGGPDDTWGRTWSPKDFTNENFRLLVGHSNNQGTFLVDFCQVRVTYTP